ncbi:kynureninase [Microbacterium luticocti]|uniref:kynureninase n=1 Tax=Microbacterium luticocti TaxID=451764 RepID=UPI0004225D6E|nr:kynureninase [Microbacterium luticocti]
MSTETTTAGWSRESCLQADERDPLAAFRDEFVLPPGVIYLDGNSLGVLPVGARERADAVITREWGTDLIRSWNTNRWFEMPVRLGEKIGRLIGGGDGACAVTDTTSVNIFKALSAAVRIQAAADPARRVIVAERDNFPTDLYVIQGLVSSLHGYDIRLIDDRDGLAAALTDDVAVTLLSHVNYRTGARWDMPAVTAQIHAAGSLVVWDLCHSVGAVPLDVDGSGADFAVGCTYKYLNGGPGSPAFIWSAARHLAGMTGPLTGWWGHRDPFAMAVEFAPAPDARRLLVGTQPIISMATMEVGLDIALRVDAAALREKSIALSTLFIDLVAQRLGDHPLTLVTPADPDARGSHVSYRHPEGYAVMQALIDRGVIGDYREPEVLRFGLTPLYLRHVDVWDAVEHLRRVLDDELWRDPQYARRGAVT